MLGQRMESVLSSQTLPKLDGQDEEGDTPLETQFEMLCATNSCPDLSVLEEEQPMSVALLDDKGNYNYDTVIRRGGPYHQQLASSHHHHHHHNHARNEDQVDGMFIKHNQGSSSSGGGNSNSIAIPSKIPLGFRRSTSLNSLGVEQDFGVNRGDSSGPPCILAESLVGPAGYVRGVISSGGSSGCANAGSNIAAITSQLDKQLKHLGPTGMMKCAPMNPTDFVRSKLRASDSGRPGYLHKSVSSPSVSQQFVPAGAILISGPEHPHHRQKASNITNFRSTSQSDAHQHSSKRSFFRRKHKFKGHSMNTHAQSAATLHSFDTGTMMMMNGGGANGSGAINIQSGTGIVAIAGGNGREDLLTESSLGHAALTDPTLGLLSEDAECWVLSMSQDVVSTMDIKEKKRQEYMYEIFKTEKTQCLYLALMHHLFIGDMKKNGFTRQSRLLFPDLKELLQVHLGFFKRLRERQTKYRELSQPVDTLSDILVEQFGGSQWQRMLQLYGLLCASHNKGLEIINSLMKDPKFASLHTAWEKEPLLGRRNVKGVLLHVAHRITKYPLLIEKLVNTAVSVQENEMLSKALQCSRDLNSKVNERVDERERLVEICQKVDPKSYVTIGQKRRNRDDLISVPSRRLLFHGQAVITCNRIGIGSLSNVACTVLILTDCLVFTQEFSGRLQFVCPPGIVMLSNLLVRPNAGLHTSMFLVISDSGKPEMIELQVANPPNREFWMEKIKEAKNKYEEKTDTFSDIDDDSSDAVDHSEIRTAKALEELQENDKQILALLRSRSKIIDTLRADKPQNWVTSQLEGKENVMTAMSAACVEVRHMITHIDANHVNVVNRSTSCVGEIGSSTNNNALQGLPKRADTFGGFDSQQRGLQGEPGNPGGSFPGINGRQLLEMVVQLEDVCGELFALLVHQMSPIVYQNYYQLQRRMEDLREAQQRLETEKALWHQEFNSQKESFDKDKNDLSSWKMNLQKEQEDITQQREQLYRKLEALQRNPCNCNWKGLVPTPDSISPGSSGSEKPSQSSIPRRPVVQPNSGGSGPAHQAATNNAKAKQQLPLKLASFSSSKGSGGALSSSNLATSSSSTSISSAANNEPPPLHPKPHPRSSVLSSFKSSISASSLLQSVSNSNNSGSGGNNQASWGQPSIKNSSSASQVQQLLPLRLSEGTASGGGAGVSSAPSSSTKTSSLPRGTSSSRSISGMSQQMEQPLLQAEQPPSTGRIQRHSGNAQITYSSSYADQPPNPSYLHGPVGGSSSSDRMNAYFSRTAVHLPPSHPQYHLYQQHYLASTANGAAEGSPTFNNPTGVPVPVVHRRSGSSPVPMTGTSSTNNTNNNSKGSAHNHHPHRGFFHTQDDDFDSSKILFL